MGGPLEEGSAWCMKHPPRQMIDSQAKLALEEFIVGAVAKTKSGAKVRQ
jgi:myo-inositol-1-phosphate synthase